MLTTDKIKALLHSLNEELREKGVIGEIGMCGGAVMCLVFKARKSTKDVDGIFEPTREIRKAALRVAKREGVPDDWLNDAAKGYFLSHPPTVDVLNLSNLRVWAPTAEYMLAMKCISARFDTNDGSDVRFLIRHLALGKPEDVYAIIEEFYPRRHIPPKTQFFIEELFGES
ncbi:MAG TPA: hypothetical protein PKE12_01900 [Kiritimatiellia bacterium]|nr:hypothetical protein [Kiritimatiellia bacterium]